MSFLNNKTSEYLSARITKKGRVFKFLGGEVNLQFI
jgi:hypothetical protein